MNYYRPIRPPTLTKSIFLWLNGLSLLVGLPINHKCTKSENHSDNSNMGRKNNELSWIKEIPLTNPIALRTKVIVRFIVKTTAT